VHNILVLLGLILIPIHFHIWSKNSNLYLMILKDKKSKVRNDCI
jgi:hypothetical protein